MAGRKLAEVKKKSQEGSDSFKKGAEMGKKAVSDVKKMKSLIDSLPTDVDDDIADAAKAVQTETKSDAKAHMDSAVHTNVETGKNKMNESSTDAKKQVDNNAKVKEIFGQMDGVGAFGKGARSEGRGKIEQSTNEFNQVIQENAAAAKAAEDEFRKQMGDIDSTL